jgi:2,5-dihydroxypyridine 5,6-dioxygenase
MPVSDDQKLAMWREVLGLCRVKAGENIAVLTGENSLPQNIDMAVRASVALGAKVCRIDVPPGDAGGVFGQRADVGMTPLTGHRIVVETLKKVDMVLDLMGLLHSPEQLEILAAGTRMMLVIEPPDMLARMIPSTDDKRRVQAAQKRLKAAKTMTVASKAGTDLTMPLGQFPTLAQWGYSDEPGHWDHWPSGFVATWPNEGASQGRVVIDTGDILLPFKFYVQSKIELDIRDGLITRIDGGFDAKYLRKHLESYDDPAAFGIAHVGWGLHPKARWGALGLRDKVQSHGMDSRSFAGNFLFSTGPNAEAGGSNHSPCHIDIPMADCSVSLDGEPMTIDGALVAPDQRLPA